MEHQHFTDPLTLHLWTGPAKKGSEPGLKKAFNALGVKDPLRPKTVGVARNKTRCAENANILLPEKQTFSKIDVSVDQYANTENTARVIQHNQSVKAKAEISESQFGILMGQ